MIDDTTPESLTNPRAWRALEAKLRPFIARRVRTQVDVDDVLQEVFVRIQRGLPNLRDHQRFGPWVYQLARSAVVDHLRGAAKHPPLPAALPGSIATAEPLSDLQISPSADECDSIEREVAAYAALLVSELPSPYREALTLTELRGLTQKQGAEMLGISLSGMKSRVQRGREKVRAALDECCDIALDARRHVIDCQPRRSPERAAECCSCQPGGSTPPSDE